MQLDVLSTHHSDALTGRLCGSYVGRSPAKIENIPLSSVLYLFTGTVGKNGLITIAGFHTECFSANQWYARTKSGVVLVKNQLVRLAGDQFIRVHQSIVVNLKLWRALDLAERGFLFADPGEPREWVPISRRRYRDVRRALGLSAERTGRPWTVPGSVRERPARPGKKRPAQNGATVAQRLTSLVPAGER